MNEWKRIKSTVTVLLLALLLLSGVQPVEAGRSRGFSASNEFAATHGLTLACVDGVEFSFTVNHENYIGTLPQQLSVNIEAAVDPNGASEIVGPIIQTILLEKHDPVPLEETFNGWLRAVSYSANDSIPEGYGINLRFAWSDFGLSKLRPGDSVGLEFSVGNDEDLFSYLNEGDVLGRFEIKDCLGDVFPAPAPQCKAQQVNLKGQSLIQPTSGGDLIETVQPVPRNGLIHSSMDIIGRLERRLPVDLDYEKQSRYPKISIEPSLDHPFWADSISPDGYVYNYEWNTETGFDPITVTIPYDEATADAFPNAFVFYNTYQRDEQYVNIIRYLDRFVNRGFVTDTVKSKRYGAATESFAFPPLLAPTDIQLTAAYLDNEASDKLINVSATAGGVTVAQSDTIPNMGGGFNLVELTLPNVPRGTSSLEFTIESPADNGDAALLTGIVVSFPCLDAADNRAQINKTISAPTIDGAVDEAWTSAARYFLPSLLVGDAPVPNTNIASTFRLLYDDNNLYGLVEVTDDVLINDSVSDYWHDDAVELYLDTNFSRGTSYDGVDDRLTIFRWNDPVTKRGTTSPPLPAGLQWALVATADGYRVEFLLPLNQIGISPTAGYTFGLDVHVHDDDDGGTREHKLAWNSLIDQTYLNPSLMGIAYLAAATNTAPVAQDDTATVAAGDVLNGPSVLANDSDADGDNLTVELSPVTAPTHGTLALNPDGTYRYTPNAGFVGSDSFIYRVLDGNNGSDTATVFISVEQVLIPTITATPVFTSTPAFTPTPTPTPTRTLTPMPTATDAETPVSLPIATSTPAGASNTERVYIPLVAR